MEQHGYDNITVEQIAKKANVSVGTYYHHFKSKFDLLVEIYHQGDVFFEEHVRDLLCQYESCAQRVTGYFVLYAQLAVDTGLEMSCKLYIPTNKMFITHGRAMQGLLTEILRLGQEHGELTDAAVLEVITEKLFVAARGVIFDWCLHDGKSDLIADIRELIGRLASTYLLPDSRNS